MIIIIVLFFILVLAKTRIISFNDNYISRQTTKDINGIFVFLIVVSHFASYVELTTKFDLMYAGLQSFLGQLIVATFLFYSGFGVMESIQKKKDQFINSLPQRTLTLLLKLDVAVIIFIIFGLIIGRAFTLPQILLGFIGWTTVGNSNWYVFVILALYILTFIIFKVLKKQYLLNTIVLTVASIGLMYALKYMRAGDSWWYNTILCYNAGMFYSLYKDKITSLLKNHLSLYWISLIGCTLLFIFCKEHRGSLKFYQLHAIIFCVIVTLISMKITIHSKFISFLGDHMFSIYILQRIPMVIGSRLNLDSTNHFIYFIFSFVLAIIIAYYFDKFTANINPTFINKWITKE